MRRFKLLLVAAVVSLFAAAVVTNRIASSQGGPKSAAPTAETAPAPQNTSKQTTGQAHVAGPRLDEELCPIDSENCDGCIITPEGPTEAPTAFDDTTNDLVD